MYKQDIPFNFSVPVDADATSAWFYCGDATLLSIQVLYDAVTAVAGTYSLESSNAPVGTAQGSIAPVDTVLDSEFEITDSDGSRTWNVADVGFNWIRVKFAFDTASPAQAVTGRIVLKGPMPA